MERMVTWVDTDQGRRGPTGSGAVGRGVTLRPTGLVVFATLDRTGPGPTVGPEGPDGWAPSPTCRSMGCASPLRHDTSRGSGPLRRVASRTASWLLGR